jgi:predicted ester cyclase
VVSGIRRPSEGECDSLAIYACGATPGGADAWVADLADLFHAFPDWQWRRIQLVVEDDRLTSRA